MSSKVHGAQRVLVDLHGLCQRLMVASVTLPRGVASFGTAGMGDRESTQPLVHHEAAQWQLSDDHTPAL